MEGGRVYAGSDMTLMLQNKRLHTSSELLHSLWQSNPSPSPSPSFHGASGSGSTSMVRFKDASGGGNATDGSPFPSFIKKEEDGNEDYESYFHQPEKKRRLRAEQVQFLEKHFEVENKLEPERKVDLAKELGLQPRQVAIWFQNRRARYKTKQLEKDYDSLKVSYDKLKADYDRLLMEKEKLKNEVLLLTDKVLLRETRKENSEPTEPIRPIDAEPEQPIPQTVSPNLSNVPMAAAANKQLEDASSARSDVFDSSDSPHYTDANHASLLEPANSSHVFEPDHSDNSHDEEDNLSRSLLPPPCFLKLEHDQPANYCGLGFPVEEQPSWLWPY